MNQRRRRSRVQTGRRSDKEPKSSSSSSSSTRNPPLKNGQSMTQFLEPKAFSNNQRKTTSLQGFTGRLAKKSVEENAQTLGKSLRLDLAKLIPHHDDRVEDPSTGLCIRPKYKNPSAPTVSSARSDREKRFQPDSLALTSARIFREMKEKSHVKVCAKGGCDRSRHTRIEWMQGDASWDCASQKERFKTCQFWNLHDNKETRPNPPWASATHKSRVCRIRKAREQVEQQALERNLVFLRTLEARVERMKTSQLDYERRIKERPQEHL